jgi:hypothetical protein
MPILASLLAVWAVLGVRLALERSSMIQDHAKSLPPLPLGL